MSTDLQKAKKHIANAIKALERIEAQEAQREEGVKLRTDKECNQLHTLAHEMLRLEEAMSTIDGHPLLGEIHFPDGKAIEKRRGWMTVNQIAYLKDLARKGNPYHEKG